MVLTTLGMGGHGTAGSGLGSRTAGGVGRGTQSRVGMSGLVRGWGQAQRRAGARWTRRSSCVGARRSWAVWLLAGARPHSRSRSWSCAWPMSASVGSWWAGSWCAWSCWSSPGLVYWSLGGTHRSARRRLRLHCGPACLTRSARTSSASTRCMARIAQRPQPGSHHTLTRSYSFDYNRDAGP